ncbi:protein of unknown function [Pararobbsia alpina]
MSVSPCLVARQCINADDILSRLLVFGKKLRIKIVTILIIVLVFL